MSAGAGGRGLFNEGDIVAGLVLDRTGNEIEHSLERTATGGRFDSGDTEIFRDDLAALLREACGTGPRTLYGDTVTALETQTEGVAVTFRRNPAQYEMRMRPFVLANQDLLSRDRQAPDADEVFNKTKMAISLGDLLG